MKEKTKAPAGQENFFLKSTLTSTNEEKEKKNSDSQMRHCHSVRML
jgi:hypothetical protein